MRASLRRARNEREAHARRELGDELVGVERARGEHRVSDDQRRVTAWPEHARHLLEAGAKVAAEGGERLLRPLPALAPRANFRALEASRGQAEPAQS
ncbi:MAG TPA: hypothetical protein VM686_29705, partial [Polyangiaceae bacterium]|nr:hypothetical protein [Polyangiaceae bacterium]